MKATWLLLVAFVGCAGNIPPPNYSSTSSQPTITVANHRFQGVIVRDRVGRLGHVEAGHTECFQLRSWTPGNNYLWIRDFAGNRWYRSPSFSIGVDRNRFWLWQLDTEQLYTAAIEKLVPWGTPC